MPKDCPPFCGEPVSDLLNFLVWMLAFLPVGIVVAPIVWPRLRRWLGK